ncbi:YtxH domain-containing protein [Dyadobacter psychrotolerans]|uniref:YtxH domain-containing protein n=1 Tax=Dyadobacter psychrotolerans TaxID=2541721 RepID=A0A4R5DXB3_9BACT|nr:YtxH domain-containing protein [Dyadobacter psychrotolerans]TDE17294.1 YtxH domain-containing protein [Dyadobacter psychrotolerans]
MKIGNILCSMVLSGSAGIIIGILLAPDKGSQTRQKIKRKAEDLLEEKIIRYNRIVCEIKTKIDAILDEVFIAVPDENIRNWADSDQKNEIIV